MERRQGRKFFSLREELRRAAIERHQVMAATPSAPPLQPEDEAATDASLLPNDEDDEMWEENPRELFKGEPMQSGRDWKPTHIVPQAWFEPGSERWKGRKDCSTPTWPPKDQILHCTSGGAGWGGLVMWRERRTPTESRDLIVGGPTPICRPR